MTKPISGIAFWTGWVGCNWKPLWPKVPQSWSFANGLLTLTNNDSFRSLHFII